MTDENDEPWSLISLRSIISKCYYYFTHKYIFILCIYIQKYIYFLYIYTFFLFLFNALNVIIVVDA